MIIMMCLGFALLILLAVVVGVLDAAQAPRHRRLAAERRERWEQRRANTYVHGKGIAVTITIRGPDETSILDPAALSHRCGDTSVPPAQQRVRDALRPAAAAAARP